MELGLPVLVVDVVWLDAVDGGGHYCNPAFRRGPAGRDTELVVGVGGVAVCGVWAGAVQGDGEAPTSRWDGRAVRVPSPS